MVSLAQQYVDPTVSRLKFEREIKDFASHAVDYRARGWFLVKADWPVIEVVLASKKTSPPAIVAAISFDYTNYDAEPPSVRMIDPFTGRPLLAKELPTNLPRTVVGPEITMPDGNTMQARSVQGLMQAHSDSDLPFLCIAGVKEYHDHPGHSGDPWEIHRAEGAGRLVRLLDVISKYGLDPVSGFSVDLVPQVKFSIPDPPQ